MSEEIQQAVQIIRVAYDGIDIAMKVGSSSLNQIKKVVDFLVAILNHEKTMGKTDLRKLLVKGGDLQVFQFNTKDLKQVKKMAKKYGILYSALPDINKEDGKSELIFHTEAVPRINMMIQKLQFGKIATFDDYLKNGNEEEFNKLTSFLKKQKIPEDSIETKKEISLEDAKKYEKIMKRIQPVSTIENLNNLEITITKNLIAEENNHAIKIQIPAEDIDRYVWIDKQKVREIFDGEIILATLDKEKDYKLYSSKNEVTKRMKGKDLYDYYCDRMMNQKIKFGNQTIKEKTEIPKTR